jgi:hypothetical protein
MNAGYNAELHSALRAFEELMQHGRGNLPMLCKLGVALRRFGRTTESRKCYKAAVEVLQKAARAGNAELALDAEIMIYDAFVKVVEDEQHYFRCFSDWRDDMARLGRRLRAPAPGSGDADRVGFVLLTGFILGHTEVLLRLLEDYQKKPGAARPVVYVLAEWEVAFKARAEAAGVTVIFGQPEPNPRNPYSIVQLFQWARDRLAQDGCRVAVWVSSPTAASFALSMRLAPVQIFWALRFRPITGPYIDGYITYGPKEARERTVGKQVWAICPVPLSLKVPAQDAAAIAALRQRFPHRLLLGTLAREEKIDSKPFLAAVARILIENPDTGYLWTGRSRHAAVDDFFRDKGLSERCHFVGWVDTALYAASLDVFLETFPLGCGITGYQALAAGTPLLSYLEENTVYGMQFGDDTEAADAAGAGRHPILCGRTPDEYVALAARLIADEQFRRDTGRKGRAFFEAEMQNGNAYAQRFFDTIAGIARRTSAAETST